MFFLSSGVWTGNNAFFIIAAVVAVVAAAVVAGVFIHAARKRKKARRPIKRQKQDFQGEEICGFKGNTTFGV